MAQPGFFDFDNRLESLSKLGDPLETLDQSIPCEKFRSLLTKCVQKAKKNNSGRKPYDAVLMFKVLILQSLYNLSDDQTEYQVRDRLSFMRFLNLRFEDSIPDAKTLWLFRDTLTNKGVIEKLFKRFNNYLDREGFIAKQGQIIDASIVPAPVQRNTRDENADIKQGQPPEKWTQKTSKLRQKDVDARWVKKRDRKHYGYKNHVGVDRKHKLIRTYQVTDASVHDSQPFQQLLDPNNTGKQVWADSAYRSKKIDKTLKQKRLENQIHYKGYRQTPLSEAKQRVNKKRSKRRALVEHVFALQQNALGGKFIRTIGILRAKAKIGLMNLAYNMKRYLYLQNLNQLKTTG